MMFERVLSFLGFSDSIQPLTLALVVIMILAIGGFISLIVSHFWPSSKKKPVA
jgi:hypothetical protein